MKELFAPYELALKVKEKGFNKQCFGGYYLFENTPDLCIYQDENEFSDSKEIIIFAPLYQQIISWLLKEHNLLISQRPVNGDIGFTIYDITKEGNKRLRSYDTIDKAIEEAFDIVIIF